MNVFAIDPGPQQSALLVWDGKTVHMHAILTNAEMLEALIDESVPRDLVACEMIQAYGMAVGAEVFETCYWIGRFIERCAAIKKPFKRIYRKDVKMHICNSPKAKDPNIRAALIDRFGPPGTRKEPGALYGITSHAWSALAIAVTAYDELYLKLPESS